MARAAYQPVERVRNDLARAIRQLRPECVPHETARRLLEYDQPGHTALVGIDEDGEHAVLYHEGDRYAIAVGFDGDGLDAGGPEIASLRDGPGLEAWVEKRRPYWGWIHPRYR